jgi:hypothetical protein
MAGGARWMEVRDDLLFFFIFPFFRIFSLHVTGSQSTSANYATSALRGESHMSVFVLIQRQSKISAHC